MSEALVQEYLSQYVAQDGGGCLEPADKRPPYLGCSFGRTNNENPILFLVQAAIEFCEAHPEFKPEFKDLYERHMASTEIEPGLHSRRCGDRFLRNQSHDNIIAMAIGGWYFKSSYALKLYDYLNHHGWNYNVKDPDTFEFKCQLQGGDRAIITWCAGFSPTIEDEIWLSCGLMVAKNFNLADLRIRFLELFKEYRQIDRVILAVGISIHKSRRGPRTSWLNYYAKNHPFRLQVELAAKS